MSRRSGIDSQDRIRPQPKGLRQPQAIRIMFYFSSVFGSWFATFSGWGSGACGFGGYSLSLSVGLGWIIGEGWLRRDFGGSFYRRGDWFNGRCDWRGNQLFYRLLYEFCSAIWTFHIFSVSEFIFYWKYRVTSRVPPIVTDNPTESPASPNG